MYLQHTCADSQAPARLLAVALIGFFCCLSAEAYPEDESPKIVAANVTQRGHKVVFSCKADPGLPDDFTLIYWLVNRTFIEMAYPRGRIHETEEGAIEENGRALIQRDLVFRKVRKEDYQAGYTCVVTNPAGIDRVTLRLPGDHQGKGDRARGQGNRKRRAMVKKSRLHLKKRV